MKLLNSRFFYATVFTFAITPAFSASAVFECAVNGSIVYSDRPCGPYAQQLRVLTPYGWGYNAYPGQMRPGEMQLLQQLQQRHHSASQVSPGVGESYSKRLERKNAERSSKAVSRRHSQEYEPRGTNVWGR